MNILEQAKNEEFVKEQFIKGRILDDTKDYGRTQFVDEIYKLQQENKKINGAIQTYDILLKANVEENKQLKERLERINNYLDKYYSMENQYWFDHIRDIVEDK